MNGLKNQQKIGEANGMPSLSIVPTQVAKTGNVGSLALLSRPYYSHLALMGRVLH